jgi:glutamate racemase
MGRTRRGGSWTSSSAMNDGPKTDVEVTRAFVSLAELRTRFSIPFVEAVLVVKPADDVDAVVLAGTHFLHLEEAFKAELGARIAIVDSREGVTAQAKRLLAEGDALSTGSSRQGSLYVSGQGPIEDRYRFFARKFDLELEGTV